MGKRDPFILVASLRVCADGAANYVHAWIESARENGTPLPEDTLWPHLICGDLDSLQSKTRYFFQEHVWFDLYF